MAIVFVGNSLVDYAVKCDSSLLNKYNLKVDSQYECNQDQLPLFDDVAKMDDITQVPGGSAQNSARIVAAIVKQEPELMTKSYIAACIAEDECGRFLTNSMTSSGVVPLYQKSSKNPTGTTAALITSGSERTLVANIGASSDLSEEFFLSPEVSSVLESSSMIYVEGYIMTNCSEVASKLASYATAKGKMFAFGISAEFVAKEKPQEIMSLMSSCDILFGNLSEAVQLVKHINGLNSENLKPEDIVKKLLTCRPKSCEVPAFPFLKRVVMVTQGSHPVILGKLLSDGSTQIEMFEVPQVKITGDAIGAGDSFVAGVLVSLLNKCTLEQAIVRGNKYAAQCLKHTGCLID